VGFWGLDAGEPAADQAGAAAAADLAAFSLRDAAARIARSHGAAGAVRVEERAADAGERTA
jgi:hypothetical protein